MDCRVAGQRDQLGFDRGKNSRDFGRRSAEVLGRENPQRHRRYLEFSTPVEDLVELIGAEIIDRAGFANAERTAVPPVPVEDYSDVTRPRPTANLSAKPARIQIVKKPEHRPQHSAPNRPLARPPSSGAGGYLRKLRHACDDLAKMRILKQRQGSRGRDAPLKRNRRRSNATLRDAFRISEPVAMLWPRCRRRRSVRCCLLC